MHAPDFESVDDSGQPFRLSQLRGRWVVLYFYPKDNTPGCTREACAFRDVHTVLTQQGATVVGVSPDSVRSHQRFKEQYELPFVLISDPGGQIAQQYGVWQERHLYGRRFMGVARTTFVIDPGGVIRAVFPNVRVDGHAEEVLHRLMALQRE
ncbi:MAG: peroxiredoxin [Candidatus Kapabacteria bacterium]|nr:peroxiredoxin [Candidatus Kapabacteria bacterium]